MPQISRMIVDGRQRRVYKDRLRMVQSRPSKSPSKNGIAGTKIFALGNVHTFRISGRGFIRKTYILIRHIDNRGSCGVRILAINRTKTTPEMELLWTIMPQGCPSNRFTSFSDKCLVWVVNLSLILGAVKILTSGQVKYTKNDNNKRYTQRNWSTQLSLLTEG